MAFRSSNQGGGGQQPFQQNSGSYPPHYPDLFSGGPAARQPQQMNFPDGMVSDLKMVFETVYQCVTCTGHLKTPNDEAPTLAFMGTYHFPVALDCAKPFYEIIGANPGEQDLCRIRAVDVTFRCKMNGCLAVVPQHQRGNHLGVHRLRMADNTANGGVMAAANPAQMSMSVSNIPAANYPSSVPSTSVVHAQQSPSGQQLHMQGVRSDGRSFPQQQQGFGSGNVVYRHAPYQQQSQPLQQQSQPHPQQSFPQQNQHFPMQQQNNMQRPQQMQQGMYGNHSTPTQVYGQLGQGHYRYPPTYQNATLTPQQIAHQQATRNPAVPVTSVHVQALQQNLQPRQPVSQMPQQQQPVSQMPQQQQGFGDQGLRAPPPNIQQQTPLLLEQLSSFGNQVRMSALHNIGNYCTPTIIRTLATAPLELPPFVPRHVQHPPAASCSAASSSVAVPEPAPAPMSPSTVKQEEDIIVLSDSESSPAVQSNSTRQPNVIVNTSEIPFPPPEDEVPESSIPLASTAATHPTDDPMTGCVSSTAAVRSPPPPPLSPAASLTSPPKIYATAFEMASNLQMEAVDQPMDISDSESDQAPVSGSSASVTTASVNPPTEPSQPESASMVTADRETSITPPADPSSQVSLEERVPSPQQMGAEMEESDTFGDENRPPDSTVSHGTATGRANPSTKPRVPKLYFCFCGNVFFDLKEMKTHVRRHNLPPGSGPKCGRKQCGYQAENMSELAQHMVRHLSLQRIFHAALRPGMTRKQGAR